jgi:hypothetical protein
MTFYEWFTEEDFEGLVFLYKDGNLGPYDVMDLMQKAWDARFFTLTYRDI